MSGQRQEGGRALAGFWRRALAALIDALLAAVVLVAAEAGYLASNGDWSVQLSDPGQPIVAGAVALTALLYDVLLTWRVGGTLGKRALGLRVAPRDGGAVSLGQVLGRVLGRVVSAVPALLGFLWAGWDRRKQTWHDKLADTVVVRDDVPVRLPVADGPRARHAPDAPELEDQARMWAESSNLGDPGPADIAVASTAALEGGTGRTAPPEPAPPEPAPAPQPAPPRAEPEPQPPWPEPQPSSQWAAPQSQQPPPPAQQQPQAQQWQAPAQPAPPSWGAPSAPPVWAPQAPQSMPGSMPGAVAPPAAPGGLTPPPPMPTRNDPNAVAIARAGLGHDAAMWLQQVAEQVDPRLDRVSTTWRGSPHAEAARACAFGLLLGHLARLYPHMRPELNATAELHPSFSTLLEGSRLATLEQIVAEPGRVAAWLGPLIDVQDADRIRALLD